MGKRAPGLKPLIVIGAGSFPEIVGVIRDLNRRAPSYSVDGILDDNPSLWGTEVEGTPILGPLVTAKEHDDALFIMGIGSHRSRLERCAIIERVGMPSTRYATLVHPGAIVYDSATLGRGCVLYPGVVVFANSTIGDHVLVLAHSVIGVRNSVCEGALITSHVSTTAGVTIGHYAHLGTGCCIAEGLKIGAGAQVCMGSVVLRDVPPGAVCLGNPARVISQAEVPSAILEKWNTRKGFSG